MEERIRRIVHGRIFLNIRDVAFGLNDGLVELLAVVVGLAAAVKNPLIVLLAGLIVAVSGTLSMAGGAYLSTEYEQKVHKHVNQDRETPLKSAFYVGVTYLIGTLFPLAPFALGMSGMMGIELSIIITSLVLVLTSATVAMVSKTSMISRVGKTLIISLGIDAITILIGAYARSAFNLPV